MSAPTLAMARRNAAPSAASRRQQGLLAQRRSASNDAHSIVAPAIRDAGRPLDIATRGTMESGFGRDLSAVRVHDDGAAHDSARTLGALAYASGNDLVFGEGQYRPGTPGGDALIAHEVAHSIQQGGVQLKAAGPLPVGTAHALEAEADAAATAVTAGRPAAVLSTAPVPLVLRATDPPIAGTGAKAAGSGGAAATGPTPDLPDGMTVEEPTPPNPGTDRLVIRVASFTLPEVKGPGSWVQEAYSTYAKGNRLIFSPLFKGKTVDTWQSVAAYKEGNEQYKAIWLNKYGFTSLKAVSKAFADKAKDDSKVAAAIKSEKVKSILDGFATDKLTPAHCDIDHIVEKQLQGSSEPPNLQLLGSKKNQTSGRETYRKLVELVTALRGTPYGSVRDLQFRFSAIDVTQDSESDDGSYRIEAMLRDGTVTGSDDVRKNAEGDPVTLSAGGGASTMRVLRNGPTPVDFNFKRVIAGMRMVTYARAKGKTAGTGPDPIEAVLDGRLLKTTERKDEIVHLQAVLAPAAGSEAAAEGGGGAQEPAAAGGVTSASERRLVKLNPADKARKIGFYYPYLSPGWLTVDIDGSGAVTGKGAIKPTIPFLGDIHVEFSSEVLTGSIDASKLKSPMAGFRFTSGTLSLQLSPNFVPSGKLGFAIGPAAKPFILGELEAAVRGGAFVASATLKPGVGLPGVKDATGRVEYDSNKGWSGTLTANSTSIPNSTLDLKLSFVGEDGKVEMKGEGGLKTTVKNKEFTLRAHWSGGHLAFSGYARWERPFRIVDYIDAEGYYSDDFLKIKGSGKFRFRTWSGTISVTYEKYANGRERFYGDGSVEVETANKKGKGSLTGHIDEQGHLSGKGHIAYQITPKVLPQFDVELDKEGHLRITGSLTLGPYTLFDRYPKGDKGRRELFHIESPKFSIPTPIPTVRAYVYLFAGVGYEFHFGPALVQTIKISGAFDPLEDDPNIIADLTAKFTCEAGVALTGDFGARLGVDVLAGAGAVEGGLTVYPAIGATAHAKADVTGKYEKGDFTLGVHPSFDVSLDLTAKVVGQVEISALWHLVSHTWDFDIASFSTNLGKKVIDPGEFATTFSTGADKGIPGAEQSSELKAVDPIDIIKGLIDRKSDKEKPNPDYRSDQDPNARIAVGNKI